MEDRINLTEVGSGFVDALIAKYKAEMAQAKSTLRLYTNNLTGIGEHSDLMTEQDKWLQVYTDAKGKLETIYELFNIETKING